MSPPWIARPPSQTATIFARVLAVVVPVEGHLVEARARPGPARTAHCAGADDVVGRQALLLRLPVGEPEADDDRGGHEDAVPADHERAELEGDGAGRGEHAQHDTTASAPLTPRAIVP